MFSNVWVFVIITFIFLGARAVRRLVTGAETAGDPLLVVGSVLYISAGIIALTFEPTPVPKIAAFLLAVAGGIAILNQFIRDSREKNCASIVRTGTSNPSTHASNVSTFMPRVCHPLGTQHLAHFGKCA